MKKIYREDSPYKPYLVSLLVIGFSYGLQKGILDNYLAEIVAMTEFDRGVLEFFRELPGLMLVGILAVMYRFSAEKIYKIGALVALVGLMMLSLVPASRVLVTLSICIYSLGEHIQLGMKNSLGVHYAKPGKSGLSLGKQHSFYDMGTLAGFLIIIVLFRIISGNSTTFRIIFAISAALVLAGETLLLQEEIHQVLHPGGHIRGKETGVLHLRPLSAGTPLRCQRICHEHAFRHLRHLRHNSLTIRRKAHRQDRIQDRHGRIGYKTVMVSDTLLLVIVCFFYGFSEYFFPVNVSFVICCAMYVMDSIISLASMASNVYVQELSDGPEETRATIATGVSVNHFVTIFVALLGGWVWRATGIQTLFTISAVIGLLNSLFA